MAVMKLVENRKDTRRFQCDWKACAKWFNRKHDLQSHSVIHTKERPYLCLTTGCGKSFSLPYALTVHTRRHTGEKPYQCQHIGCAKRFPDSSSCVRHRRIHTGERPYKCTLDRCMKSFGRKATMLRHQRGPHKKPIHSEIGEVKTSESEVQHSARMMRPGRSPQKPQVRSTSHERHQDVFHCQNKHSYVPEQDNRRVATLNTDTSPITQSPHHQLSQHLQSSTSSSSAAFIANPAPQRDVYSLFPTIMATHALQSQQLSLIGQQPMVCYQHLLDDPGHLPYCWTGSDCRHGQATSHIYCFADEWEQKLGLFGPLLQMPSV